MKIVFYGFTTLIWLIFALTLMSQNYRLQVMQTPIFFKVYFKDIGLLSGYYGAEVQQALMLGEMQIKHGALLEAVVADVLMKSGKKLVLFFNKYNT